MMLMSLIVRHDSSLHARSDGGSLLAYALTSWMHTS